MDKNIENNIKHHFENRRINPDQKAWSKLDGLLAQSEKRKPYIYRLAFKTSAAVGLIIFGIFFSILFLLPVENAKTIAINSEKEQMIENSLPSETSDLSLPIIITDKVTTNKNQPKISSATSSTKMIVNTHNTESDQPVYISNKAEESKNTIASDQKVMQETTNHLLQVKSADFVMVDPQKLLSDTENSLTAKSHQEMHNKYEIDPNKLLRQAEKEVNKSYLLNAIRSMKEISSPMISAVMSRNEIKAK